MTTHQKPNPNPAAVVVNDDVTQLNVLASLLTREGIDVRSFENAEAALKSMESNDPPDLIVTDLYMPAIDGWRFCRLLRSPEYETFNNVPILVVSATFAGEEAYRITTDLGANAFLSSPVEGAHFIGQVRKLLKGEKPQKKSRVLVVEDSQTLSGVLKECFQVHGYQVQTALTGDNAVAYFNKNFYDFVILDYHLPDIQGDELLVRFQESRPETVFIMVTADPLPELALEWMKKGASAYVQKPFELDYLIELCNKVHREKALLRVEDLLEKRTRELRAREEDLRAIVENLNEVIYKVDGLGRITYVSPNIKSIGGYEASDVMGRPFTDFVYHEDISGGMAQFDKVLSGRGGASEYRFVKNNGETVWVRTHARAVMENKKIVGLQGALVDISDLKETYDALQQSEERFKEIANLIPTIILEMDLDLKITYINQTGLEVFGVTPKELDTGIYGLAQVHPGDRSKAAQRIQQHLNGIRLPPAEFRLIGKNDKQISVLWNAVPIMKENQPIGLRAIVTEITELKRLQETVIKANKLESIGTLAGGIAHDFNNILTNVIGNITLAQMNIDPNDQSFKNLNQAEKGALLAKDLAGKLITFSKGGSPVKRKGSIAGVLIDVTRLVLSGSNATHSISIPDDLYPIEFDANQLSQVFQNVLQNAKEAMPKGGSIDLIAENIYINEAKKGHGKSNRHIKISIKDQGKGISEEHMDKIFDPYFSTKKMGVEKGMGLGLSIVYSIVAKHRGEVIVDSIKEKGTTVSFLFPALSKEDKMVNSKDESQKHETFSADKILLMDDEEIVLDVTEQMLDYLGYQVTCAKNGEEAIALFESAKKSGQPFSLVLLDLTIKDGMGGLEAFEKIRHIDPEVRAFAASGYSDDPVITGYKDYGFAGALPKPYYLKILKKAFSKDGTS